MKKTLLSLAAAAAIAATGCTKTGTTITQASPYEQGYAVGVAAYLAYERIAQNKGDDFKAKAALAWSRVEAIDSADTLATDAAAVLEDIIAIESAAALTEAERKAARAATAILLMKLDAAAAGQAKDHPEIVEFLKGARSGVDAYRPKAEPVEAEK